MIRIYNCTSFSIMHISLEMVIVYISNYLLNTWDYINSFRTFLEAVCIDNNQ